MCEGAEEVSFPEFLEMVSKCPTPDGAREDILTAFRLYDRAGSGTISAADLKYILSNFGEPLAGSQLSQALKLAGDPVKYDDFVNKIFA